MLVPIQGPPQCDKDLSEQELTSAKCPDDLCANFGKPRVSTREERSIYNLLHESCTECSSQVEHEPLCRFCRHLRLRHLAICLRRTLEHIDITLDLTVYKHYQDMSNTKCVLCSFLANSVQIFFSMPNMFGEHEEDMREVRIQSLSLKQAPEYSTIILKICTPSTTGKIEIAYHKLYEGWRPNMGHLANWPTVQEWINDCTALRGWTGDIVTGHVNWPTVKRWIHQCISRHHLCTRPGFPTRPQGFRLIDVGKRKLVSDFPPGSKLGYDIKFVTLSYVWGKPNTSRTDTLLSSNKSELTAPGGLGKLSLPKAIEDAITVCQQLHQPFLWVDRLCIQQDDDGPEKQAQLNAMGDIYSAAEFTIIHASGVSMDDPIAGVTTPRKVFQSRTAVCGLELVSGYPGILVSLQGSKWNERGWTYQEAVLSQRKLFFTPFELWFACSHIDDSYQREEQCSNRWHQSVWNRPGYGEGNPDNYGVNSFRGHATKLHDFIRHLELYTARTLTHQSDILDAFNGILTTLYEGDLSIYGLPEADFDIALLWHCKTKRRPMLCASNFPSWSWSSVTGIVTIIFRPGYDDFLVPITKWYYKERNGELKSVRSKGYIEEDEWSRSRSRAYIRRSRSRSYLLVLWWKRCIEPAMPENVKQEFRKLHVACRVPYLHGSRFIDAFSEYMNRGSMCDKCELRIAQRWPRLGDAWEDIERAWESGLGDTQYLNIGPQEEERQLITQLHPGVLLTHAQTASFKVSVDWSNDRTTGSFLGSEGVIGRIWLGGGDTWLNDNKPGGESKAVVCECVGISLSKENRQRKVNMLVIHRKEGSPFWRRIAVGWVHIEDWIKADRTFKTIGLE